MTAPIIVYQNDATQFNCYDFRTGKTAKAWMIRGGRVSPPFRSEKFQEEHMSIQFVKNDGKTVTLHFDEFDHDDKKEVSMWYFRSKNKRCFVAIVTPHIPFH